MKSTLLTLLILCFGISISAASSITNPWDADKIEVGDIHKLQDVQFDMDEAELKDGSEALAFLLEFLLENKNAKIELRGHTNSIPAHSYCDELSEKRAQAVKKYLVKQGVNADNLIAKGYGKRLPINSNLNATGRQSNQRVDVKVLSL